jgi:hypothetical protein
MKKLACINTGDLFYLRTDEETHKPILETKNGSQINNFYTVTFPVTVRTKGKEEFVLNPGEVYIWSESIEEPYHFKPIREHRRFTNFKKIRR